MIKARNRSALDFVFARHEVKYRLPAELYKEFLSRTADILEPDLYPHSQILNVYYDTEHNDLISRSIGGASYKEKLRLRSYGIPDPDSMVFPELKKKYAGIVYKRRAMMSCREAERFLDLGDSSGMDGQIVRELVYFLNFYHPQPKLFIAYDRDSFAGIRYPDLRVTVDRRIRYREDRLRLGDGDDGELLDTGGDYIMEVKAQDAIPLELVKIFSSLRLYPDSFSKYGTIYKYLHHEEAKVCPLYTNVRKRGTYVQQHY